MASIAYVTDVEGQWSRLAGFVKRNPYVRFTDDDALHVAEGAVFVFGGDTIDRGDDGRRIVASLLAAKRRQPSQVVLLCGNRDLNKLRLVDELATPPDVKGGRSELLRRIFAHTMGAPQAFEHRATELRASGEPSDPESVVDSFLDDLAPDGALTAYLSAAQLAYRHGTTLFVHGAVTSESFGRVPGLAQTIDDTDAWLHELECFHRMQMAAFRSRERCADGRPTWEPLVRYQAPIPGTRFNQASVVYGRLIDDACNPVLPSPDVIGALRQDGIERIVVGHTSNGDCPGVIRDGNGFEMILADHSHGRTRSSSQVFLDDNPRILGTTQLQDGALEEVETRLSDEGPASPLGTRRASGHLVKGRLGRGDYLLYRCSAGYRVEHATATADELGGATWPT